MEANSLTSFKALSFYFWVSLPRETVFMAKVWLSSFFRTSFTDPKDPEPKSLTASKSESFSDMEEFIFNNKLKSYIRYESKIISISNQINESTILPKASHDPLFANESAFLLNTLVFYSTHKSLPIAKGANYASLYYPTFEIAIYLYDGFLALFHKWY
jgi:hypothetical protein